MEIMRYLLDDPSSAWWDDRTTQEIESRDDIIMLAFKNAVQEIQKEYSENPTEWKWGEIHTITFEHQVMRSFPFIKSIFNRGPFPTGGGSAIVNATGWNVGDGYQVSTVPSMRMIVDLSNLTNSWTVHTTGQSGHVYHQHYIDMADPWRLIRYYPMDWEVDGLALSSEGHLTLVPDN
jgi:penicillin amidase